jgi:hypothetical protein
MARFVRSADVVVRRVAGELVLVPTVRRASADFRPEASFHVLNESGEFLWEQLESPADVEELTSKLMLHYEIDADVARRDVESFLTDLASCGAIQPLELT